MIFGNADFAFGSCSQDELKYINSGVSLDELPSNNNGDNNNLNNSFYKNELSNSCDKDIDSNIINLTNCKYYSVDEYYSLNKVNNFNIFHNNVNGL